MTRPLIRRICVGVLLTAAILVAALGVYQTAYRLWAHRTTDRVLSCTIGWEKEWKNLERFGDRIVPVVFDEMRAHPSKDRIHLGESLLWDAASRGKLHDSAYLRGVLADTSEKDEIRAAAAGALSGFYQSTDPEIETALLEQIRPESSVDLRCVILGKLGVLVTSGAFARNDPSVSPRVISAFRASSTDPDPPVRRSAFYAVCAIAHHTPGRKSDVSWCYEILIAFLDDPDPGIREKAREAVQSPDRATVVAP